MRRPFSSAGEPIKGKSVGRARGTDALTPDGSQLVLDRDNNLYILEARDFVFRGAGTAASTLDVSADGQRFLAILDPTGGDAPSPPLVVVEHWLWH